MNYLCLDEYAKAWVFKHQELLIAPQQLAQIKPMTPTRSAVLWSTFISRDKDHPDFFSEDDWLCQAQHWQAQEVFWEQAFEDETAIPEQILSHLDWQDNTTVYFCNSRVEVIETRFDVFKQHWQNFMFLADGSILIGKKRPQVVQFMETGFARLGEQPK
ncbi:hypothetical protein FIU82_11810 [Pseudoalteromonas sp. THAF3]|uniref:DUF2947 family protein n=1 Tax=Pseudoalteromonas TaxID=53246 RepID=UPI00110A41DA|nr:MULTISPECIES: DUF2947 family protein [Pseudoalteromonas]QFU05674.1 hypothetical protein FIU82_11810 [Pseudoalteromonas sp. THAF3]TMO49235.1 DUF2947 domain-containing protein [Pseudoalteromonas ruthenica]TMO51847.1 DUF2947 domain-containing protein [Pseudoalteromonas ruthenica]